MHGTLPMQREGPKVRRSLMEGEVSHHHNILVTITSNVVTRR